MRILYAEDEKQLSVAVTEILKIENYEVTSVYDGMQAWEEIQKNRFDAIILDIMMPKMSGLEVLAKIREAQIYTPVLLLTAKAETEDRIAGLSEGADDYLAKPFAMGELMARVNAMIRRVDAYKITVLRQGNLSLHVDTNEMKTEKGSLVISNKESELLALFLQHKTSSFTAEEIGEQLWGEGSEAGTVKLYVSYLQNKLRQIHSSVRIEEQEHLYRLCD